MKRAAGEPGWVGWGMHAASETHWVRMEVQEKLKYEGVGVAEKRPGRAKFRPTALADRRSCKHHYRM